MKRIFWMYLSLILLATPVHATSSDTTKVYLGSGETAVVISDTADPVTYRVTDRDMARWASMVNRSRTIVRNRVVHDTVSTPQYWAPYKVTTPDWFDRNVNPLPSPKQASQSPHASLVYLQTLYPHGYTIDDWWPLLFMLVFLGLLVILVSGIWRDHHGRDGRDGVPGRDGRDAPIVTQSVVTEGHWLSIGTVPEGTEITIKRDRQPAK